MNNFNCIMQHFRECFCQQCHMWIWGRWKSLKLLKTELNIIVCVNLHTGSILFMCRLFSSPEHEVLIVSYCGQWLSVVVRHVSCVVCRPSTFDVYTLETTFVIRFLWNLVRMFDLRIPRPSSNIGHVRSKTRSPGQILENSFTYITFTF